MPRSRKSALHHVLDELHTVDRFAVGDPRRAIAQRRVARLIATDPALADHPRLTSSRPLLRRWGRFAPYLLSDQEEAALTVSGRHTIDEQLALLRALDEQEATALSTADRALAGLDSPTAAQRRAADLTAHEVTDRRAPTSASVLAALARCHLADDQLRGIADWRTRFAVVQGTSPATLMRLRDATKAASTMAAQWRQLRAGVVGGEYSDRRVGLRADTATLAEHAQQAAGALATVVPTLAAVATQASGRIVNGSDNQVVIEADGRISVTVVHRSTPRGSLMVAHEIGHAVHALASRSPEPPGALVGETVACWSSLVTGLAGSSVDVPDSAAMALALGDTLVEELFVSAAVSEFEDSLYALVESGGAGTVAELNELWLQAHGQLLGDGSALPEHVGSGWARLPSLATDPGHAFSYVWATVLALAIVARSTGAGTGNDMAAAVLAGGVEADEFTALLGFEGDEWIDEGLSALEAELARLGQRVLSASFEVGSG